MSQTNAKNITLTSADVERLESLAFIVIGTDDELTLIEAGEDLAQAVLEVTGYHNRKLINNE